MLTHWHVKFLIIWLGGRISSRSMSITVSSRAGTPWKGAVNRSMWSRLAYATTHILGTITGDMANGITVKAFFIRTVTCYMTLQSTATASLELTSMLESQLELTKSQIARYTLQKTNTVGTDAIADLWTALNTIPTLGNDLTKKLQAFYNSIMWQQIWRIKNSKVLKICRSWSSCVSAPERAKWGFSQKEITVVLRRKGNQSLTSWPTLKTFDSCNRNPNSNKTVNNGLGGIIFTSSGEGWARPFRSGVQGVKMLLFKTLSTGSVDEEEVAQELPH